MKIIITLIVLASLSGCIISPNTYFLPISDEGNVKRFLCNDSVGPKQNLFISLNGADLNISAHEHDRVLSLFINFNIFKGNSANWNAKNIILKTAREEPITGNLNQFTQAYFNNDSYNKVILVGELMEYVIKPNSIKTTYVGHVKFESVELSEFLIHGLSFKLNGIQHNLEPIKFKKQKGIFLYPLNC